MSKQDAKKGYGVWLWIVPMGLFALCGAFAMVTSNYYFDLGLKAYESAKSEYFVREGITFPVEDMPLSDQLDYIKDSQGFEQYYQVKASVEEIRAQTYGAEVRTGWGYFTMFLLGGAAAAFLSGWKMVRSEDD